MKKVLKITVPLTKPIKVSAILEVPPKAKVLLVMAHGAGAGMKHTAMTALAKALHAEKIATFRYQFPYMEKRSKRPDSPDVAVATVVAAVNAAVHAEPKLAVFAGGKSFGGRMTTTAASRGEIEAALGIVCFGFPLHAAKKPSTERAEHLETVGHPMLFLQGTRDQLSDLKLLRPIAGANERITLHTLAGADHGYAVLKSSGRTGKEVLAEVARATAAFLAEHAP